jgi:hypothetical protein
VVYYVEELFTVWAKTPELDEVSRSVLSVTATLYCVLEIGIDCAKSSRNMFVIGEAGISP